MQLISFLDIDQLRQIAGGILQIVPIPPPYTPYLSLESQENQGELCLSDNFILRLALLRASTEYAEIPAEV